MYHDFSKILKKSLKDREHTSASFGIFWTHINRHLIVHSEKESNWLLISEKESNWQSIRRKIQDTSHMGDKAN